MEHESLRNTNDVEAILQLAVQESPHSNNELRDQLNRSANELGITQEALIKAENRYRMTLKIDKFMKAKATGFQRSLIRFLAINLQIQVLWFILSDCRDLPIALQGFFLPLVGLIISAGFMAFKRKIAKQRPTETDPHFLVWIQLGEPEMYPVSAQMLSTQRSSHSPH